MKVWMRRDDAGASASAARVMSLSLARDSEHTVESLITEAIALTDSKSPLLAAANPASITSTRMRSSCLAMRSFSSRVIDAPGLCSPSRRVVSKMIRRSMDFSRKGTSAACQDKGSKENGLGGKISCARGAAAPALAAEALGYGRRAGRGMSSACGHYIAEPGLRQVQCQSRTGQASGAPGSGGSWVRTGRAGLTSPRDARQPQYT